MRLEDIELTLPNGFHDALLERLTIDYRESRAVFDLELSTGNPDAKVGAERNARRKGRLQVANLIYCAIEPPHSRYLSMGAKPLRIGAGPLSGLNKKPANLPEPLPEGAFAYWFFVSRWNSFIFVAATDASFTWREDSPAEN